ISVVKQYLESRLIIIRFFIFFFQAEDGIRDFHVTGVQTCALPISEPLEVRGAQFDDEVVGDDGPVAVPDGGVVVALPLERSRDRSEERRVGKECRPVWSRDHTK